MALALAYVNEVMQNLDCTVVVDEQTWPQLIALLKFEGRDLEQLILGRMKLRQARGGYEGLMSVVDALLAENKALREQVQTLNAKIGKLTVTAPPVTLDTAPHG